THIHMRHSCLATRMTAEEKEEKKRKRETKSVFPYLAIFFLLFLHPSSRRLFCARHHFPPHAKVKEVSSYSQTPLAHCSLSLSLSIPTSLPPFLSLTHCLPFDAFYTREKTEFLGGGS